MRRFKASKNKNCILDYLYKETKTKVLRGYKHPSQISVLIVFEPF